MLVRGPTIMNQDPWTTLDGRLNAPSGAAQFPTLLNGYPVASPPGARVRWPILTGTQPPWMVAGVDYRVGINTGITLAAASTLPTSGSPRQQNGNQIIITGANVILDSFDCTGFDVLVQSATNFLIQNCKISVDATGHGYYHATGTCSGTVQYCEFYENYTNDHDANGGLFFHDAVGSLTVQYCYLERAFADFFDIYGGAGVTDPVIIKYNVIHSSAGGVGAHADWLAAGGSAVYGTLTSDFNLWYNIDLLSDVAGVWGSAGTQPVQGTQGIGWDGFGTASNNGPISVSNNTIIATSGASMNYLIGIMAHPTSGAFSYTTSNNYVDASGASTSPAIQRGGATPHIIVGNINMPDGSSA